MNPTYDPTKQGLTQGLLTIFMRCREEAKNHIMGLEIVRSSGALQFGSMTHRCLELIYKKWKVSPSRKDVLKVIRFVEKEFMAEEGSRLSVEGLENLHLNLSILNVILPKYFEFYTKDFKTQKWLELEEKFCVPSPVEGINLVGRIDGAYKEKKELWLFESKTKGRIEEESLSDSLSFDFQNNLYQYALRHKYNRCPDGVLYNIIRRPGQKLGKNETLTAFGKRIENEIDKDPAHYFIRFEVAVPPSELKRFEIELKSIVEEFYSWWKGEIATYRNTSACLQKFGPCRFLPLCANNDTGLYRKRKEIFPELVD